MADTLTLKLEQATGTHFDSILDIQKRADAVIRDPIPLTRADLEAMQQWPRMQPDGLQVILDDDRVVGLLRYLKFIDAATPLVASIVLVDPDRRDEGIADWAYSYVLKRAQTDGARVLDTIIDQRDREAHDFLTRRKFKELVKLWTLEANPDFAPQEPPQIPGRCRLRSYQKGQDAELLAHLFNRTFNHHAGFALSNASEMASSEQSPAFDPAMTLFLEDENGQAMGFARNTVRGDARDAWIDMLGVDPDYQGKGYGRFLLLHSMYLLANFRPRAIRLAVEGTNDTARALYDSEGFMDIRTRVRYRKTLT